MASARREVSVESEALAEAVKKIVKRGGCVRFVRAEDPPIRQPRTSDAQVGCWIDEPSRSKSLSGAYHYLPRLLAIAPKTPKHTHTDKISARQATYATFFTSSCKCTD